MSSEERPRDAAIESQLPASKNQFGILAIFWATFIVALSITYLQRMDEPTLIWEGLSSVGIGLLVGFVVGLFTKQIPTSMIWATLIAAFGFICVASDSYFQTPLRMTWAVVGAVSGTIGATVLPSRFPLNGFACAVAALVVMSIYTFLILGKTTSIQLIDVVAAPVIGFLVASLIELLKWIESQVKVSRYFLATLLMIMIIIGTLLTGGLGGGVS